MYSPVPAQCQPSASPLRPNWVPSADRHEYILEGAFHQRLRAPGRGHLPRQVLPSVWSRKPGLHSQR